MHWEIGQRWLFGAVALGLTVGHLADRYVEHARTYYRRRDGSATGEHRNVENALVDLRIHAAHLPVDALRPSVLRDVRQQMIERGLSRRVINQRVGVIRRMFRWGVELELVQPSTWHALLAVRNLQPYRSDAKEREPVRPVPLSDIEATKREIAARQVRAMIDLQLLTGMRPGEVVQMRLEDVTVEAGSWIYHPPQHKSIHRGRHRAIPLGPKAREVIGQFLPRPPADPLFSPKEAWSEWLARRAEQRVTPGGQGNGPGSRQNRKPRWKPGPTYTASSYRRAIHRGCDMAGVQHWSPNQLRHTAATLIEGLYGLDGAQAVLGHAKPDTTRIYSDAQREIAERIMREIG